MKLVNLVKYLITPELLPVLYELQCQNPDSEIFLIYMKGELALDSEIFIFDIEETEDDLFYKKDDVEYVQLFSVSHVVDLMEYDLNLKSGYSDLDIAKRLLQYRLNDA